MNLAEGLQYEIKRNYELLEIYKKIPAGQFAAIMIREDLDVAHKAIAEGDVIEQMRVYESLKDSD